MNSIVQSTDTGLQSVHRDKRADRRTLRRGIRLLCMTLVLASLGASMVVPDASEYLIFSGVSVLLVASTWWRNFSWSYAFLAGFFLLGHWLKVTVHAVFDYRFLEPVGAFDGSPEQWSRYYSYTIAAMLALVVGRAVMAAMPRQKGRNGTGPKRRAPLSMSWVILSIATTVFYALNTALGFYRTGINVTVVLPYPFNAIGAFFAFIGVPVVVAWFVSNELASRGSIRTSAWVCLFIQGVLASISMASRLAFALQVLPVSIAVIMTQQRFKRGRLGVKYLVGFSVVFVCVLGAVSMYRINAYYGSSVFDSALVDKFASESSQLLVDRWVGVEGVLVAASTTNGSLETLYEMLREDPNQGVSGIYQVAARSFYVYQEDRTFLTLPGVFAILAFSGSSLIVFAGVGSCLFVARLVEYLSAVLSSDRLPVIVLVSAGIANAFCQMSFPYLLLPFIAQLVALLAALCTLSKRSQKRSTGTVRLALLAHTDQGYTTVSALDTVPGPLMGAGECRGFETTALKKY